MAIDSRFGHYDLRHFWLDRILGGTCLGENRFRRVEPLVSHTLHPSTGLISGHCSIDKLNA
jgi:hypothetical protein